MTLSKHVEQKKDTEEGKQKEIVMTGSSKMKCLIETMVLQTVLLASGSLTGFSGNLIFKKGQDVLKVWFYI